MYKSRRPKSESWTNIDIWQTRWKEMKQPFSMVARVKIVLVGLGVVQKSSFPNTDYLDGRFICWGEGIFPSSAVTKESGCLGIYIRNKNVKIIWRKCLPNNGPTFINHQENWREKRIWKKKIHLFLTSLLFYFSFVSVFCFLL